METARLVLGGFSDADLVTGVEESRGRARQEMRRRQRLHFAESSNWPRLDLADLTFHRHHVEHTTTGAVSRIVRGEVMDAHHSPAVAWYLGSDGGPVFLEPV